MEQIGEKALRLLTLLKRAFGTRLPDYKIRLLYQLKTTSLSPREVASTLGLDKTNVAHLAADMLDEGLIIRSPEGRDGRKIFYSITPNGEKMLHEFCDSIENRFSKILTDEEYLKATTNFDEIIRLLEFL